MYTELGRGRLDTGEPLDLGVVRAPDPEWAPRLRTLLGHKPPVYGYHIQRSLAEPLDDLETLFYVGCVGREPVTVSMVAGGHGAGVYGHVYTVPAWRQRGASRALHQALAADVRARGYRVLTLGTDPRGHARRLYASIGFREVLPGSGDMIWQAEGAAPAGACVAGRLRWEDWGWVSEACCAPPEAEEERPRSLLFRVRVAGHVEATFIEAMRAGVEAQVLRAGEAVVAWAALLPAAAEALGAVALEWYARPGFRGEAAALLDGLRWPDRPVVCLLSGAPGYRAAGLGAHGFRAAARWPDWWQLGRGPEAATLWVRP